MLDHHYLSLNIVRLKRGDVWNNDGGGLCFVFPKDGASAFTLGAVTQPLAPGDVLVLGSSMSEPLTSTRADGEFVFWWFSASLEHLFPLFASKEICLVSTVADSFKRGKLYAASTPLAAECHKLIDGAPPQFGLAHRCQVLRIAAAILSPEFRTLGMSRAGFMSTEEQMTLALEKLSASDILSLPVGELARRFNCSQRHLNRLFHDRFGVSVASFRMEMRLLKAIALLRNPDAKVIDVAEDCGFNHLGLFNTCFKRRFGSSPGKWRQTMYQLEAPSVTHQDTQQTCSMLSLGLCPWAGESKVPRSGNLSKLASNRAFPSNGGHSQANSDQDASKARKSNSQRGLEIVAGGSCSGSGVGVPPATAGVSPAQAASKARGPAGKRDACPAT